MPLTKNLLNPSLQEEKRKHKKKRLVQSSNSYFMNKKHPQFLCVGRSTVLCQLENVFRLVKYL
uniref:Uncharacterized protein n=1 Tax=Panthera tigris altaica TaxID=74533 RepID=A0A8C9JWF2_PANTA